jgi:hypothetical protein
LYQISQDLQAARFANNATYLSSKAAEKEYIVTDSGKESLLS